MNEQRREMPDGISQLSGNKRMANHTTLNKRQKPTRSAYELYNRTVSRTSRAYEKNIRVHRKLYPEFNTSCFPVLT